MIDVYVYCLIGALILFAGYKVVTKRNKTRALGKKPVPVIKETYPTNEK